ncbi:WhiB family transcriptional regulator [Streptomyces sp. NPDC059740]|uniref:WhiB family transcriptional regulator n=1 Tax=Streptomyces sp. NPDC059740 TaxID=3346926 RepID=UPI00365421C8
MTAATLHRQLTDHRHYAYRACAPDPDHPGRAQGDLTVPVNAWLPHTDDDTEAPSARHAREKRAAAVCAGCPVLDACRTYALAETPEGKLTEPEGVWGGLRPLERHRDLIARRTATPAPGGVTEASLAECRTPQKQALLRALARETDEELVAYRADMDVRTANWHRSILCGLLRLNKDTTTRSDLLAAARRYGVIPADARIRPEGRWPVPAAPDTTGTRQRAIAPDMPQSPKPPQRTVRPYQMVLPGYEYLPRVWHLRTRATGTAPAKGRRLRLIRAYAIALPLPLPPGLAALEKAA